MLKAKGQPEKIYLNNKVSGRGPLAGMASGGISTPINMTLNMVRIKRITLIYIRVDGFGMTGVGTR